MSAVKRLRALRLRLKSHEEHDSARKMREEHLGKLKRMSYLTLKRDGATAPVYDTSAPPPKHGATATTPTMTTTTTATAATAATAAAAVAAVAAATSSASGTRATGVVSVSDGKEPSAGFAGCRSGGEESDVVAALREALAAGRAAPLLERLCTDGVVQDVRALLRSRVLADAIGRKALSAAETRAVGAFLCAAAAQFTRAGSGQLGAPAALLHGDAADSLEHLAALLEEAPSDELASAFLGAGVAAGVLAAALSTVPATDTPHDVDTVRCLVVGAARCAGALARGDRSSEFRRYAAADYTMPSPPDSPRSASATGGSARKPAAAAAEEKKGALRGPHAFVHALAPRLGAVWALAAGGVLEALAREIARPADRGGNPWSRAVACGALADAVRGRCWAATRVAVWVAGQAPGATFPIGTAVANATRALDGALGHEAARQAFGLVYALLMHGDKAAFAALLAAGAPRALALLLNPGGGDSGAGGWSVEGAAGALDALELVAARLDEFPFPRPGGEPTSWRAVFAGAGVRAALETLAVAPADRAPQELTERAAAALRIYFDESRVVTTAANGCAPDDDGGDDEPYFGEDGYDDEDVLARLANL